MLLALLGLGLSLRLRVAEEWHVPAGDGLDYHALSQQLRLTGRYAYAPPPAPLRYTRMPGYPVFLAYVAVRQAPLGLEPHLRRATRANAVLDVLTALLVFLILREARLFGALLGAALAVACPLLILLSCYGLGESLATMLTTLAVYLLLRAGRSRLLLHAALAGVVLGLAGLVRADTVTLAPALLPILWAAAPPRRRLAALALCGGLAALVFLPWPVRNVVRFGTPHASAWYWRARDGAPLPLGFVRWARTFGAGRTGETYLDLYFVEGWHLPIDDRTLLPWMFDSAAERARVRELYRRYNREGLSAAVDLGLAALGEARARREPLRTYVSLPLRRLAGLWRPVPEEELPMVSRRLGLPERRPLFSHFHHGLCAAALAGALWLLAAGGARRRLALLLLGCLALRSVVLAEVVAVGLTQRHLVEVVPLLCVLAAAGLGGPLSSAVRRWRSRSGRSSRPPR